MTTLTTEEKKRMEKILDHCPNLPVLERYDAIMSVATANSWAQDPGIEKKCNEAMKTFNPEEKRALDKQHAMNAVKTTVYRELCRKFSKIAKKGETVEQALERLGEKKALDFVNDYKLNGSGWYGENTHWKKKPGL